MINDLLKTKYVDYRNCARCDGDRMDAEQTELILEPNTEYTNGEAIYLTEMRNVTHINGSYTFAEDKTQNRPYRNKGE